MSIVNVALVGATGDLGSHILSALLAEDSPFTTTALQRASSTSKLPTNNHKNLKIATVSDDPSLEELTQIFTGQDAVIICYRARDAAAQIKFGQAAFQSGTVRRFIPADFGSCDSNGARERELVKLFDRKVAIRESLQKLANESTERSKQGHGVEFSWTSLVNGHFFDWGLRENFLHFDLPNRKADIIDDGALKSSQATLSQIAKATVKILQKPEETKNRMLFIQSFCVSQNQILASLEKAMPGKWELTRYDSEAFIRERKERADAGDADAIEDLVFVLGAIDGNWEGKEDFAMGLLGLEEEDLDEVVKRVVDEMQLS